MQKLGYSYFKLLNSMPIIFHIHVITNRDKYLPQLFQMPWKLKPFLKHDQFYPPLRNKCSPMFTNFWNFILGLLLWGLCLLFFPNVPGATLILYSRVHVNIVGKYIIYCKVKITIVVKFNSKWYCFKPPT